MDRLRAIVDAGVALASELSLDAVLKKIVETAAELTGAQYAALGVIDPTGQALERFIVTGIDPADAGGDRRAPTRPWHPRCADRRCQAAAPRRPRGRSSLGRLPAEPSTDALVPRRPDPLARSCLRQPVLDREGGRRPVHGRGRGADDPPVVAGCRRDRERAAVRGGDPLAEAARVPERDLERARLRGRPLTPARPHRHAAPRAHACPHRSDRASRPGREPDHPRHRRRRVG